MSVHDESAVKTEKNGCCLNMAKKGGCLVVVVVVVVVRRHGSDSLEVSRWLPNRLRASTFVSRGPDQAPFPNDYGFSLSTAEPCATERREDV